MKSVNAFVIIVVLLTGCSNGQDTPSNCDITPTVTVLITPSTVPKMNKKFLGKNELEWESEYQPIMQKTLDRENLISTLERGNYAVVNREDYLLILTYIKIASIEDVETLEIDGRKFTVLYLYEYTDSSSRDVAYVDTNGGLAYIFSPCDDISITEDEIQKGISSIKPKTVKNTKNALEN